MFAAIEEDALARLTQWFVCRCVFFQKSYSMPIGLDFQKRYATTVLELEQLNKDLNKVLHQVQQFCCEVAWTCPAVAACSFY